MAKTAKTKPKPSTTSTPLSVEEWPLDKILPYEKNARKIPQSAIDKVAASLKEYGWQQPIVTDKVGVIVVGHVRRLGALQNGWKVAPVHVASKLSSAQIKAYRLMDNRSHSEATFDMKLVEGELMDLKSLEFDISLTGFEMDELPGVFGTEGLTDPDAVPEAPVEPVTKLGDLWLLGEHRLLCGDSTNTDAAARLLNGTIPDLVFTDPPYGIEIVKGSEVGGGGDLKFGKVRGGKWVDSKTYAEIANDHSTQAAQQFYHCAIASGVQQFVVWGGNYFTDFLPPSPCWVIWDKENSGNFADVEMAWTSFPRAAKLYAFMWNGLARKGDRKTELLTRVHPTQKPVGLFVDIFEDFPFTVCYDGFLGSGSTLIACEKTNRTCYGMELSPAYCDVIVKRWEQFTGKKATLEERPA